MKNKCILIDRGFFSSLMLGSDSSCSFVCAESVGRLRVKDTEHERRQSLLRLTTIIREGGERSEGPDAQCKGKHKVYLIQKTINDKPKLN